MTKTVKTRMGISAGMCALAMVLAASAALNTAGIAIDSGYTMTAVDDPAAVSELTVDRLTQTGVYELREYNGHVAVYTPQSRGFPEAVTSIEVDGLRGVDRDLLEQGITAGSYGELMLLLEDLGS